MHWFSLIAIFIIVNICQTQPNTFKNFETGNINKGGTFQTVSGSNDIDVFGTKASIDGSIQASTTKAPSGNPVKQEKDTQNPITHLRSSGNNNYYYFMLPFIITGLMIIIHF